MKTVTLGRTGITVCKNAFGALPIQRVSAEYAGKLLQIGRASCRERVWTWV